MNERYEHPFSIFWTADKKRNDSNKFPDRFRFGVPSSSSAGDGIAQIFAARRESLFSRSGMLSSPEDSSQCQQK